MNQTRESFSQKERRRITGSPVDVEQTAVPPRKWNARVCLVVLQKTIYGLCSVNTPSRLSGSDPVSLLSFPVLFLSSTCLCCPCLTPLLCLSHSSHTLPNSFPLPLLLLSASHSSHFPVSAISSACITLLLSLSHPSPLPVLSSPLRVSPLSPLLTLSHPSPLPVSLLSSPCLTSQHRVYILFEAHDVM